MRPQRSSGAFTDPRWEFSFARGGHRLIATLGDGLGTLRTRRGVDVSDRFPAIAAVLGAIAATRRVRAVLDGTVTGDDHRQAIFRPPHMSVPVSTGPPVYWLQDVMMFDGHDVCAQDWSARRAMLRTLSPAPGAHPVRLQSTMPTLGTWLLQQASVLGLAGIEAHRREAPYREGPSLDWLLIPCAAAPLA